MERNEAFALSLQCLPEHVLETCVHQNCSFGGSRQRNLSTTTSKNMKRQQNEEKETIVDDDGRSSAGTHRRHSSNDDHGDPLDDEMFRFSSQSSSSVPMNQSPHGSTRCGSDDGGNSASKTVCDAATNSADAAIDYTATKLSEKERSILIDKYCHSTGVRGIQHPDRLVRVQDEDGQSLTLNKQTIYSTVDLVCINCMPIAVVSIIRVASVTMEADKSYRISSCDPQSAHELPLQSGLIDMSINGGIRRIDLLDDCPDTDIYSEYRQEMHLCVNLTCLQPVAFDFPWIITALPVIDTRFNASLCDTYGAVSKMACSLPAEANYELRIESYTCRRFNLFLSGLTEPTLAGVGSLSSMLVMTRIEHIPQIIQAMTTWSLRELWLPSPFANFTLRESDAHIRKSMTTTNPSQVKNWGPSPICDSIDYMEVLKKIPNHIAIIMDGNGRWAEKRGMPRSEGHKAGVDSVLRAIRFCRKLGVHNLTVYAFSSQNWQRPPSEVNFLMKLLLNFLQEQCKELLDNGVRMIVNGRTSDLPFMLRQQLDRVVTESANNKEITVCLALSYGGREEIVDTTRAIVNASKNGEIDVSRLDEKTFRSFMPNPDIPDPDLLIRTSGELRLSNFLLWHLAYAEIYVTQKRWPEFEEVDMIEALTEFSKRKRRFGKTQSQVNETGDAPSRTSTITIEGTSGTHSSGILSRYFRSLIYYLCPSGRSYLKRPLPR